MRREHWCYLLDASGQAVPTDDLNRWAKWFAAHNQDRVVARTEVGQTVVSTVFLAVDHQHGGPPLLWETAVFTDEAVEVPRRYPTREAALAGHDQLVARERAAKEAGRGHDR